jgi:hypothetical protein
MDNLYSPYRADLDALRRLDLLVVHVVGLDAHLAQGLRGEQRADRGHDGAVQPRHHDGLPLAQSPVDQDHVHGGAQALDVAAPVDPFESKL